MSAPGSAPKVAILGAGSMGTALAAGLHKPGRSFTLWTIEDDVAESLRTYRENVKYLPGVKVPREVEIHTDLQTAMEGAAFVVVAVPSHVVREVARRAADLTRAEAVVVSAAKGLERGSLKRMSEAIAEEMPAAVRGRIVAMAGPSLAGELGAGVPTGVDAACADLDAARSVKIALSHKKVRIRVRRDVAGVEAGGTFKNLYAIGAGICDGLQLGNNTKAALITRALSEMVTLARSLGAKASTLSGLSGLGDLMVTCTSPSSRNRTLGEHLGRGHKVAEITRGMVSVTEGVDAAHCAHELAAQRKLRVPLAEMIYAILNGEEKPERIVKVALP